MLSKILPLALLLPTTLALQASISTHTFGAMLSKRQDGYYPGTDACGTGDTCEIACGANTAECPSSDASSIFCHSTLDGSHCCSDGSGNSCGPEYYCTSDGAGTTYCCPEGVDTAECASLYSLTISLIEEASTTAALPAASETLEVPPVVSAETSAVLVVPSASTVLRESTAESSGEMSKTTKTTSAVVVHSETPNATRTVSSSLRPVFTGGARKLNGAGAMLMGIFGLAII